MSEERVGMSRLTRLSMATVAAAALAVPVFATGAHFVGTPKITVSGSVVTVSGKAAGLGNVTSVDVTADAEASCTNRGGRKPGAANKTDVTGGGTFSVQNGKVDFSFALNAPTFSPPCDPPMTVSYSLISVTVSGPGINLVYP